MENYYKPCAELDECRSLDKYWFGREFDRWFEGYLSIALRTEYPLAECQVGYC